jgi:DNA-binding transcriptional MerR regulator
MTHLSVKALRHYHEVGLLEPADVDPGSGYRLYDAGQVATAQVIRRFRDLGMPLDGVRQVLRAPDLESRNRVIAAHLERMESELAETRTAVASLRTLLEEPRPRIGVEFRSVDTTPAVAIAEPVELSEAEAWWEEAFTELYAALTAAGVEPAGPAGALWSGDFFEAERGEVVAFVPVAAVATGLPGHREIEGGELAVALHRGPFAEIDRTYGALGTVVAERAIGVDGPIREHYLVSPLDTEDESSHRTEVCWPVFQTRPAA